MKNSFNFVDDRLSRRADYSLSKIQTSPDQSLPQIFNNYADLEGFYRLIKNSRVSQEQIMDNIAKQTQNICETLEEVAVIHDTTFINPKINLRSNIIGKRGLMSHLSLAVNSSSTPEVFGALALNFINRSKEGKNISGDKESGRWLGGVYASEKYLDKKKMIHLMDREADSFDTIHLLTNNNYRFVIRASHNRPVKGGKRSRLFDSLREAPELAKLKAKISKREDNTFKSAKLSKIHPKRNARDTQLSVSTQKVQMYIPKLKQSSPTFDINVIRVWEKNPPIDEPPVEWFLLTSEEINNEEKLIKVVNLYRRRWLIEEFFKGLKTGCKIEEKQFEDIASWKKLIPFYLGVAFSLINLRVLDKVCLSSLRPSLSQEQIDILRVSSKSEVEDSEALLFALANLGGHIKYNGPPGWQTWHLGKKKLLDLQEGWRLRCD